MSGCSARERPRRRSNDRRETVWWRLNFLFNKQDGTEEEVIARMGGRSCGAHGRGHRGRDSAFGRSRTGATCQQDRKYRGSRSERCRSKVAGSGAGHQRALPWATYAGRSLLPLLMDEKGVIIDAAGRLQYWYRARRPI